jgi:beta-glucosidase/6-phospho-beta-glucosidase/beta-galactosidase
VQDGDERRIGQPLDFLGINYYYRTVVQAGDKSRDTVSNWPGNGDIEPVSRGLPQTEMGWEIDADGLYDLLTRIARDYSGVPLYVTENGAAFPDVKSDDGQVHDPTASPISTRTSARRTAASQDGADLRGYFVWSLMDNFEWSFGFSKRFGLIHVDYETLEAHAQGQPRAWLRGRDCRERPHVTRPRAARRRLRAAAAAGPRWLSRAARAGRRRSSPAAAPAGRRAARPDRTRQSRCPCSRGRG